MKHTKAPWETKAQGDANHFFTFREHPRRGGKDWLMSIQFNGELSVVEQEANVRLIDAAPKMLEALEMIERFIADGHNVPVNVVRQAISLAKEGV